MKKKILTGIIFIVISILWIFLLDFTIDKIASDKNILDAIDRLNIKEILSLTAAFICLFLFKNNKENHTSPGQIHPNKKTSDIEFLSVSFNELIKSTNDGYILLNKDLVVEKYNENGIFFSSILFNVELQENVRLTDILPHHSGSIYDRILPSIFKGNVVDLYDEINQPDGDSYNFYIRFNPVYIEEKLTFVYILIKDISMERENKRKLIEFNLTIENLLSNSRDGFISIAKNGNIKNINLSALQLLLLDKKPKNLFNIGHLPGNKIKEKCEQVWENKMEVNFDLYIPSSLKWVELKIIPYWDSLSLFIQDITTDIISHQLLDIEKDALEIITKNDLSFHHVLSNSLDRIQSMIEGNQLTYFSYDFENEKLYYFSSGYSTLITEEPNYISLKGHSKEILKEQMQYTAYNDPYQLLQNDYFKLAKHLFTVPIFDQKQNVIGVVFLQVNFLLDSSSYIDPLMRNIAQITQNIFDYRENYFNLERLSLVAQSSPKGYLTIDSDHKIIWVNQSFLELFSFFSPEIINKDVFQILSEIILLKKELKKLVTYIKNYKSFTEEIEIINKSNNSYIVQIQGKIIFSGNENQYLLDFENISERKKQENTIRENALFLQKITESVPFVLFQYRFDEHQTFKIPFISKGIAKLNSSINIKELERDGTTFFNYIDPKFIGQLKYRLIKYYLIKKPWEFEFKMFNENLEEKWIKLLVVPRIETNGDILWYGSLEDVTQKKEIAQKMQETELKHKKLFDSSNFGIIYYDKKGNIIDINQAVEKIFSLPKHNIIKDKALDYLEVINENFIVESGISEPIKLAISSKKTIENCVLGVKLNGDKSEPSWINCQVYPIFYNNESEPEYYFSMIEDISEKYNAQKKLEESNMRFLLVSNAVNEAIWDWKLTEDTINWSDGFTRLFGYEKEEYPNRNTWQKYFHPDDYSSSQSYYYNVMTNTTLNRWSNEYRLLKKNGDYAYVKNMAYIIRDKNGKALRLIGSLQDITEKRNFELQKTALVNNTQEEERKRFSMELHDGLAQYLVALNLYMNQLDNNGKLDYDILDLCKGIIQDGLNLTRALCYSLSPPELNNGLIPGVKALYERLEALNKINFTIIHKPKTESLFQSNIDSYNIFRIIQEFTNNSLKYAQCQEITCLFTTEKKKRVIYVKDNGKGFDILTVKKGFGLENMEKRAKLINGQISIKSKIGVGTELKLILD